MARLREQMERLLRISNYSERTRSEYLRCAQHFADSIGKSPAAVGVEEIHAYLDPRRKGNSIGSGRGAGLAGGPG